MSGKPIKLKDLIEVKFTPIKDDGKKSLITKSVSRGIQADFVIMWSSNVCNAVVLAATYLE